MSLPKRKHSGVRHEIIGWESWDSRLKRRTHFSTIPATTSVCHLISQLTHYLGLTHKIVGIPQLLSLAPSPVHQLHNQTDSPNLSNFLRQKLLNHRKNAPSQMHTTVGLVMIPQATNKIEANCTSRCCRFWQRHSIKEKCAQFVLTKLSLHSLHAEVKS